MKRHTTTNRYPIERAGNIPLRVVDAETGELLSERFANGMEILTVYGTRQRKAAANALDRALAAGIDAKLVEVET
jgi:hypothetical protein